MQQRIGVAASRSQASTHDVPACALRRAASKQGSSFHSSPRAGRCTSFSARPPIIIPDQKLADPMRTAPDDILDRDATILSGRCRLIKWRDQFCSFAYSLCVTAFRSVLLVAAGQGISDIVWALLDGSCKSGIDWDQSGVCPAALIDAGARGDTSGP